MNRTEYIDALDGVYKRVKELRDAFGLIRMSDAEPMEDDRRKKTAKMIDDLADRLYEDGAISSRIAADNAAAGKGEQGDLFDDAERDAGKANGPVVDVQPLALPEPKCVHFDATRNGCGYPEFECPNCETCDGTHRECSHFSLDKIDPNAARTDCKWCNSETHKCECPKFADESDDVCYGSKDCWEFNPKTAKPKKPGKGKKKGGKK